MGKKCKWSQDYKTHLPIGEKWPWSAPCHKGGDSGGLETQRLSWELRDAATVMPLSKNKVLCSHSCSLPFNVLRIACGKQGAMTPFLVIYLRTHKGQVATGWPTEVYVPTEGTNTLVTQAVWGSVQCTIKRRGLCMSAGPSLSSLQGSLLPSFSPILPCFGEHSSWDGLKEKRAP